MHKNKALQVAMAAALSLGVTVAQAGVLKLVARGVADAKQAAAVSANDLKYAYEQFNSTGQTALAYKYRVFYAFADSVSSVNSDFYITFTLSDKASFSSDLYQVQAFKIYKTDGTLSAVPISRAAGGAKGEKSVTYLVQATKTTVDKTDALNFEFEIQSEGALSSPGGIINLGVQLNAAISQNITQGMAIDTAQTIPLAMAAEGLEVRLEGSTNAGDDGSAYIDVTKDSQLLGGTAALGDNKLVDYGRIVLRKAGTLLAKSSPAPLNGAGALTWEPINPPPGEFKKASLTIQNGNFNASGQPSDGNVYIELTTTAAGGTGKINATSFPDSKTARWELTDTNLKDIFTTSTTGKSKNPNPNSAYIWLKVKGDTPIEEYRAVKPMGVFQVDMLNMALPIQVSSELRHLKKNGTVCTLYNIPPSEGPGKKPLDVVHIRMTNTSSVQGIVKGRLRDMNGVNIYNFGGSPYEEFVSADSPLGPNQTKLLEIEDLTKPPSGNSYSWNSRTVLTLESNIPEPKLEIYLLLRPNNVEPGGARIGPLMNLSTGLSGNGCD